MPAYRIVTSATRIPVPGGKLIEELFGRVNTNTEAFSLAHMVAPAGWGEPWQTPVFGELTVIVRGRLQVEIAGERLTIGPGQAIWIDPRQRVRYSNPFEDETEYFAFCMPAFSSDLARRAPE